MSELKTHRIVGLNEKCDSVDDDYYLKSDADKVIAELQEKLKEQTSIAEEGWKEAGIYHTSYAEAVKELYEKNKEARHHKYKRCLAMARWCRYWAGYWETCEPSDCSMFIVKARYYRKWRKRWLELAEKFKHNN